MGTNNKKGPGGGEGGVFLPIQITRLWLAGQQMASRLMGLDRGGAPDDLPAVGGRGRVDPDEQRLIEEANAALREWQTAQAQFQVVDGVRDPDLVDHAIYHLEAAERRYVYLLRQLQQVRGEGPPH